MADLIENCKRHRGMIGLLTVLGALLLGVRAQQQEFRLVGSDVTLVPNKTRDLKEITWTSNDRIVVEFVLKSQKEPFIDLTNDRTTINKTNGALTIRNLDIWDSGVYKAQVILMDDSIKVTEIRLAVRDCPDQPIITVQSTEDQFVVFCKSFSPDVTYEWFNQTRSVNKSKSYAEPKKNGTLTCVVDNKVCNKSSSINFYIPDQPEEKKVGYDVTLVPQYTGDPSEIIWKVNGNKLVEMELKPWVDIIFYYLQDRATISHTDGSLTIRGLTEEDTGDYTAVVLVNNDYYYTEIRLESEGLPGWIIALTVVELFLNCTPILWYCCYKKSSDLPRGSVIVALFLNPIIIAIFTLWYYWCKEPSNLPRWIIAGIVFEVVSSITIPIYIFFLWYYFYKKSERCITVQFCNDVKNGVDESQRLLEDHSKRIQSPRLTIRAAFLAEDGNFTADAVMSDGKPHRFTQDKETSIMIVFEDKGKTAQELVFKKDGVTQFEYAFSSLKLHASNITLEPGSVIVYNAEGEQSYRVNFQLEEHPESKSICCITFHPSNMTGKDKITWKKDSQRLNTGGDGIKCDPNGDLTIYNATSKDKGTYTVQCKDKKLVQEFILQL